MAILENISSGIASLLVECPWWIRSIVGATVGAVVLTVGPPLVVKSKNNESSTAPTQQNSVNASGGTVVQNNYYVNSTSPAVTERPQPQQVAVQPPSVIASDYTLFWIDVGGGRYQLGAMLTLGSGDQKSHQVTRLKVEFTDFRIVESDTHLDRFVQKSGNGISDYMGFRLPADEPYFAPLLLPITIGLDASGRLPEDVKLEGNWTVEIDSVPQLVSPRQYFLSDRSFTLSEWDRLHELPFDPTLQSMKSTHILRRI